MVYIIIEIFNDKDKCFSPLQYWGGLYHYQTAKKLENLVLVPFDVGVVYIFKADTESDFKSFNPLRYWGGLYLIQSYTAQLYEVLVPFDIGVVYI